MSITVCFFAAVLANIAHHVVVDVDKNFCISYEANIHMNQVK